jgi:phosphoribosylamine--glycine ligase
LVFHAGTRKANNTIVTDGGRVLAVTGRGESLEEAVKNVYQSISGISWSNVYFRRDIGVDLLQLENAD